MSIVTISRGSYSRRKEIAEKGAIHDAPSILDRFNLSAAVVVVVSH